MEGAITILDSERAFKMLERIACQIEENCYPEKELIILGIDDKGLWLAQQLQSLLTGKISCTIESATCQDKSKDSATVVFSASNFPAGKTWLVVDDVLYSGRTLFITIAGLIPYSPKRILSAVLIDRGHRQIPVSADFTGMVLATTLQEKVKVEIDISNKEIKGYLVG
jgi:pyrimidine operon attenuation protein/uracil phosphoribosyltransferase